MDVMGSLMPSDDVTSRSVEREYLVGTFPWTNASTDIGTISFPDALFSVPYIADRLKYFRFFSGSLRIRIRVNGNAFTYGLGIAAFDPAVGYTSAPSITGKHQLAGLPHVLFEASSGDTHELLIPWCAPLPSIDVRCYIPACMGQLRLAPILPIDSTNISSLHEPVEVNVYASFVETVVGGPGVAQAVAPCI